MKLLFVDLETTGFNPRKHGIVQIAGLIEIDGVVKDEFNFKVRPYPADIVEAEAIEVNGLTDYESFPRPDSVYVEVLRLFQRYVDRYNKADKFFMVGQNTKFDYDFLDRFFVKNLNNYLYAFIDYHLIDLITLTCAMKLAGRLDIPDMKLKTVCEALNLGIQTHNAADDIKKTRQAFYQYIRWIRDG